MTEFEKNLQAGVLIDWWQEKYPTTFPKKPFPKVPLKIGIHNELIEASKEVGASSVQVFRALRLWCHGYRYRNAIMTNCLRYGIDGSTTKNDHAYMEGRKNVR